MLNFVCTVLCQPCLIGGAKIHSVVTSNCGSGDVHGFPQADFAAESICDDCTDESKNDKTGPQFVYHCVGAACHSVTFAQMYSVGDLLRQEPQCSSTGTVGGFFAFAQRHGAVCRWCRVLLNLSWCNDRSGRVHTESTTGWNLIRVLIGWH